MEEVGFLQNLLLFHQVLNILFKNVQANEILLILYCIFNCFL